MADSPQSFYSFGFIGDDLKKQIESSREILNQVKALKDLENQTTEPEKKKQLQNTIEHLIRVVDKLTANVVVTSATASSTIGSIRVTGTAGKK